jgi:dihydroorotase
MSNSTLIKQVSIVNEGRIFIGDVLIKDGLIEKIAAHISVNGNVNEVDAKALHLFPGVIDDQVHFREPGLTHKADIYTESRAAVAGGITSFMEMPNTVPNTLTQKLLQDKYDIASGKSLANYSFFMGVSNDNMEEVLKTNQETVCGVKIFMGSSTGNMLVDNIVTLEKIFAECPMLIAAHCEDETTIKANLTYYQDKCGDDLTVEYHPLIRSAEACYISSSFAVQLAKKHNSRFHVLHISTSKEIPLFDNTIPLNKKRITSEACIHHLWFSDKDYILKGNLIKWNPAIKTEQDRTAVFNAVLDNHIDIIATDHAPHTLEEKQQDYLNAPSGGPLVQHALPAMLDFYHQGKISLEKIAEKMCHAPAECFKIKNRGFIREGFAADLVLVDLNRPSTVTKNNIYYKCRWSPFEGHQFQSQVVRTLVNGNCVYTEGTFDESIMGQRLLFGKHN